MLTTQQSAATSSAEPALQLQPQAVARQAGYLGSSRFSALYMQQPQPLEDQLFPEKVWATIDQVNADDLLLVASAWDTASKTGEKNDFTANVVIGRLRSGGFVVLDVWQSKLNFAKLPDVVLNRYGLLVERYRTLPVLVVEDADSGTAFCCFSRLRDRHAA